MTTKIFRGDATAIAQVTRITPAAVEIGDTFTLTINGKTITVTATAATVANVVTLLVAAVNNTSIPEFLEVTATADGTTSVLLTANTAGVPFVVTASASNGGIGGVSVTTTTHGAAASGAVSAVVSFAVPYSGMSNAGIADGTFRVYHLSNASSAIAVGASAATVQTAIQAITSIGAGNVTVTKSSVSPDGIHYDNEIDSYTVTFAGALANSAQTLDVICSSLRPVSRRVQRDVGVPGQGWIFDINFGVPVPGDAAKTYTLAWGGNTTGTLALNALESAITAAIITSLGAGQDIWEPKFQSSNVLRLLSRVSTSSNYFYANNVSGLTVVFSATVTIVTAGSGITAAVNEVQVITLANAPTGGTFTLTYSGQTTSAIAYDASAATVDAALEALSNIGAGDVAVTGAAGGPWTVTFGTALAGTNVPEMTGSGALLTGGSVQTFAVATVTASAGPNHWDTASNWSPVNVPITGDDVRFENSDTDCLYGLDQTGVTLASLRIAMTYTGQLGLKRENDAAYLEYRTTELTCGITSVMVGYGDGGGPRKVALNTLAVQTTIELRGTGGSSESYIPTVTWRGSHASNVVTVLDGEFGTAQYSNQSAVIYDLLQRGGSVSLKNTAVSNHAIYTRQRLQTYNCTLGGKVWDA